MLKKFGLGLLCVAASISTPTYSMMTHALRTGVTLKYDLPPQEPQLFINYMFWSVDASCKMAIEEDIAVDLFAEGVAKKGKINGVALSVGETMELHVQAGEILKLHADSGAKVRITNLGSHTAHATCSS